MENYKSLSIDCLEKKREIMAHKEEYAKMFSEGRESLEKLLLTCYEHDIMSQACCSGHLLEDNYFEESYLYLKLRRKDLDVFSKIISLYKKNNFKKLCDLEESILTDSNCRDYFGFCIRCDFDDADDVYSRLIDVINSADNSKGSSISIEYEVLELLKQELLKFREKKVPKYGRGKFEVCGATLAQTRGGIIYPDAGKYLDIFRTVTIHPDDVSSWDNPIDIEELTKYINDHTDVDYTDLIARYRYESSRQLNDLKKVLVKRQ